MEKEHLSFVEAVELLAQRAGMQVPHTGGARESSAAKGSCVRVHRRHAPAPQVFLMRSSTARRATRRARILKTGYFTFGGAPVWDRLCAAGLGSSFLKSQGAGLYAGEITAAGLAVEKIGKFYDMFVSGVMFPILQPAAAKSSPLAGES